jgi:hypothetical protein
MKLLSLLVPALCWGATTSITVDQLITMARTVPGEFSADALIRIAAIDKVEKNRKIELLEEAFRKAGEAQLPYKRRAATTKVPGPAGAFNRSFAQGLDAMSLRVKAVNAMLAIDGTKAREMFLRIPPIKLPRLTCNEFLVYDVEGFYDTLGRIATQTFTADEVEKGASFRFLQPYISAVASPVQLPAAARLIADSNVSDKNFEALVAAFGKAMAKISGDDRSFTFAAVGPQIGAIVEAAQHRKLPPIPVIESYRAYVVNNMSGTRCADDELMINEAQSFGFIDPRLAEQQGSDPAVYFNGHLRIPPLKDIQETEVTPSKVEGAASGLRGCEDGACKALVQKYLDLIYDSARNPFPASHKETPEWQKQFQEFIASIEAWQPAEASAAAGHFREKCALYSDLASVAPNSTGRETVLRAELEYVRKNNTSAENRSQWLLPISALIGRVTLDPLGLGKLTDDLRSSGDPVITLFVELDAVAPRTPTQIMPLI